MPPELQDVFSELAPKYRSRFESRTIDLAEDVYVQERFKRLVGGADVIDLGCGPGSALAMFPSINDYLGIDFATGMVQTARGEYPDRDFRVGDVTDPDLEIPREGEWDVALSLWALIYVDKPPALATAYRALRPGGTLIAQGVIEEYRERESHVAEPHHLVPSTAEGLARDAREAGFRRVRVFGFRVLRDAPWMERVPVGALRRLYAAEARLLPAKLALTHFVIATK